MIPVQFITSSDKKRSLAQCQAALKGGCKWIQASFSPKQSLKEKTALAGKLKTMCRENDAMLVVSYDIELAKAAEADGVFLEYSGVGNVRHDLGEGFIIGATASNIDEILNAKKSSADYVVLKLNNENATTADIRAIVDGKEEKSIDIPVVVSAPNDINDVCELIEAGVNGFSVCADNIPDKEIESVVSRLINI